ncbi:MAG TPA: AAA family ATPase, partial [Labilithrix sp.]
MTDEPLVGRRIDRAAIANLFDEGARLVSIVGPGGMGKTRLARAVAQAFDETDDGRSWFVDLTSVTTSSGLASTIATAIGVRLARDPIADLGRALHRRGRLLLVLDNFEQLVADGARAVGALVAAAPRARMLVTTRLALDLPGEYRWPLAGLEIAAPGAPALLAVESVDLFVRRARQMRPDLPLDDDTLAAIAAIGAKLEGIPLAIELAAARTSALSPAEIRDRLASHEDVLVRRRDAGRHGSMRAVVAGSFRLLADAERACLLACAVFDAGFTLDAADAVLGAPALACLEALVAHSLVRRGAERFHLYEVIREFALGEIDDALLVELQARHAAHFARVAGHARAEDLHDLLRAHAHAIGAHDGEAARALARAAAPILFTRGLLVKRLELLDETLAIASAPELLVLRGHTHAELGAFEHARRDYETALATGDDALAHVRLGELVEARGDTAAARASYEAALASVAN